MAPLRYSHAIVDGRPHGRPMPLQEDRAPVFSHLAAHRLQRSRTHRLGARCRDAGAPGRGHPAPARVARVAYSPRCPRGASHSSSQRLDQEEVAHTATLTEVEQLQTQNAMLDIIARSVDVPLAFQALAGRVSRLVPRSRRPSRSLRGRPRVPDLRARAAGRTPGAPRPEIIFAERPSSAAWLPRASRC